MTTISQTKTGPSWVDSIRNLFERVIDHAERHSELGRRSALAQRLFAMTDDELAELGLRREEICSHAFAGYMY